VEAKALSLAGAYEQLQGRRAEAERKRQNAAKVSDYAEAINAGEMTMEQTIQKAIEEREAKAGLAAEADARGLLKVEPVRARAVIWALVGEKRLAGYSPWSGRARSRRAR
jgi:hypothetical protein